MNANRYTDALPDCSSIQELIPDYAFGLTDQATTQVVEAGLVDCPDAVEQLTEFRRLQMDMRAGVPQIDPSAHLAEKLLKMTEGASTVSVNTLASTSHKRPVHPAWFAAAAAILVLLLTNIYWFGRVDSLTNNQIAVAGTPTPDIGAPQTTAFVFSGNDNLRWVRLPSSTEGGNASAVLMWNAESRIGLLYAQGFPQLQEHKIYVLWLTREGERRNVGTFYVDDKGKGVLLFNIDEYIDNYTWAWITVESAYGSETPSEDVVVKGDLTA
ncbi:MAG: anti-sigma factor [Anaerolineae bacterium]|nr:anti-sigma factor [Anaerolineae bacterium]